jgi:integrase
MPRKRTTRREKGEGNHWYDKKNKRHVWTIEHDGERHKVTDRDEAQARLRFEELKRQVLGGVDVEGARVLLKDYLPRYIDTEVAPRFKESTAHDSHKRADLYILPTLGELRLCDIKRRMVVAWINGMVNEPDEKGKYWSFNSIKQALSLLRRALQAAVPELLEYNPAADVKMPTRRKGDELRIDDDVVPREKSFSDEQVTKLLTEVLRTNKYHNLYLLYLLAVRLGLRRGELCGLRWKDVDLENRVIRVKQQINALNRITTPKSDSAVRDVPFPEDIATMLRAYKLTLGARGRVCVFPNDHGNYRRPDGITQHFARVCKRLGFVGYTFHSLRHTAITDWRTDGVDLEVAAALAGHKGVKVTAEVYSAATMDRKRAAVEKKRKTEG